MCKEEQMMKPVSVWFLREITLWNYIYHGNQNTALSFSIFSSADMHMNVIIITSIRISFSSRCILCSLRVRYPIQPCISISTYSGSLSMWSSLISRSVQTLPAEPLCSIIGYFSSLTLTPPLLFLAATVLRLDLNSNWPA